MTNKKGGVGYEEWVYAPEGNVHESLFDFIQDYVSNYQSFTNTASVRGVKQYLGRGMNTLNSYGYMAESGMNQQTGLSPNTPKLQFNLTAAVIDTLTAKLASIKAAPQAVTNKATVKGRRLAEDINHLVKGTFHNHKLSNEINLGYRGAMIARAQFLKVCVEEGKVWFDKVYADEIVIDPADGFYNNPYKMVQRKFIPLHVAIKKWPQYEKELRNCHITDFHYTNANSYTPCIVVAEAWCKNTYKPGGRHVIAIETLDLLDEDWDKDYFPIEKFDYNPPVIGYLGQSVTDELMPIQAELDRCLVAMQSILKLMSVPRVFVDVNAMVNDNHITNKVGIIIKYDGKNGLVPQIHNGASMPPELPRQVEFLIAQGFARVGLTAMDVQGQKPMGLDSGEALKTMTEIKSERWQRLQDAYEQSHVNIANILLNELKGTNIKVTALDKHIGIREISAKKIPDVEGSYVLQMFPVSSLPEGIADRIDTVQKMIMMGILSPTQAPELFQMPDIEGLVTMQSAPMRLIDTILENMEDNPSKYIPPEPYYDLNYALTTSLQKYSLVKFNKGSEAYLKQLRRFINDIKELLKQAQAVMGNPQLQEVATQPQPIVTPQVPKVA